jgi:hypothetical protein
MTTPIITFEVLSGWSSDTGQEFHLVVFRGTEGRIKRAQLRLRNTQVDDWSPPLELKHLPPDVTHPSVA